MARNSMGFNARHEINEWYKNIVNPHSYSEAHAIIRNVETPRRYIGFQRTPYDPTVPVIASTIGYQSEGKNEHGLVAPYSLELWEEAIKQREESNSKRE